MASIPEDLEVELKALLEKNQKIAAIKLLRERLECGLVEAKQAVEEYEKKLGKVSGKASKPRAGCLGLIVFLVVAVVGITYRASLAWYV